MAGDVAELMRRLGHERFAVAGHDRGCYVAFRLALDHPERVTRLAVLDGVPGAENHADWLRATRDPATVALTFDPRGTPPRGGRRRRAMRVRRSAPRRAP